MPNLLTALEARGVLADQGIEVHVRTVRRWCASGHLKSTRHGLRVFLIDEADLDGFEPPKRGRPYKRPTGQQPQDAAER